ncbi:bifunctional diguanylate cyclase/phosphodiesterase [Guyparkeria halophila]|uniref:Bifunctional diguanylate cyclase/phosphodiesterase n=1 Tax=Guyparkeria halophila TaxID=47960 RepID=A0ABZ0YYP6_9GAMM|nr:bifunctional diguanylate cyclase/phosphodiesterase [Guyparkeria halophila]WQH17308.1 bifunctional diguanylate cyclase/phosphodiesterase [Guyparkeria halophila]
MSQSGTCCQRCQEIADSACTKIATASAEGTELRRIFRERDLTTLFQPLVACDSGRVLGWEALLRGPHGPLHRPLDLFRAAERHGCLVELDVLSQRLAIRRFAESPAGSDGSLFLNVMIESVQTGAHLHNLTGPCVENLGMDSNRVVMEISELHPTADIGALAQAVSHFQREGFRVALDDVGAGYNGLRLWAETRPDMIKVDRYFVHGIHASDEKRRFLEAIVRLAHSLGSQVVGEGLEEAADLEVLVGLNVEMAQGYLYAHPAPVPPFPTHTPADHPATRRDEGPTGQTARTLAEPHESLLPFHSVADVADIFLRVPHIDFYPVVKPDGQVLGMVWRREFMNRLLYRYGYDLFHRKPINRLMDRHPIIVDVRTPLETVSRLITDSDFGHRKEAVILVDNGRYVGVGTFTELLRLITDIKVQSAHYANPLSGLPGNIPIRAELQRLLDEGRAFTALYIDLDHFKPYNDHYSYEDGDKIIRHVSHLLQRVSGGEFVGHIGGDDFVLITRLSSRGEAIAAQLIAEFASSIGRFYSAVDREAGGIVGKDRQGEPRRFPLMSLSIGAVHVRADTLSHQQHLSSLMTRAKKAAKAAGGNTWYLLENDGPQVANPENGNPPFVSVANAT